MNPLFRALRRLRLLASRSAVEREMDEEMRFHLAMEAHDIHRTDGLPPEEAERRAALAFGGVERFKEEGREARGTRPVEILARDLRLAARRLRMRPGFTIVALVTLALGIGATTAVFSVVDAVLLRPLPYPDPDRLVGMWHTAPGLGLPQFEQSDASIVQYARATRTLASVGGYDDMDVSLTGDDEPERVSAAAISASLLPTLGIVPALGRGITAEDDRPGAPPVVVLSHALWQRRFGGDRAVLGQTLRVDGVTREIVGVMPESFQFPDATQQLWFPLALDPSGLNPASFSMYAIGRLRPGATIESALAELQPLLMRIPDDHPGLLTHAMLEQAKARVVLHPLRDDIVGDVGPLLVVVLATVGLVLLIACANVANLFLVRAEGRQREVALRAAIGARASDLTRLFLSESLVLSVVAGALGVAVAWAALAALVRLGPDSLPRLHEVRIDGAALAVTFAVALATGLAFGALPVRRARRATLSPTLRDGGRAATGGRDANRARNAFVVAQVALALVLLAGSGLMARSFQRLRAVDPGFRGERVLTFRISLPESEYRETADIARFYQELADRLAALPGVESAGAVSRLPLVGSGSSNDAIWIEDHPVASDALPPVHSTAVATSGYFGSLGIALREGRAFAREDHERPTGTAIVSRAFAERYWPGASAVGKRVRQLPNGAWYTIVGVVGDVHTESLAQAPEPTVYFPMVQHPADTIGRSARSMAVVVRARGAPESLADAVRREVWAMNANLPLVSLRPMSRVVAAATGRTSFTLVMLGAAASVALLLGAVGIYGVIAYTVSLRTREIGVRMALGAPAAGVRGMVVRQGLALASVGVLLGLVAAVGLTRFLASLLYGVEPTDPLTLAVVATLLLAVAALASWLPARRAASIDPVEALRGE